MLQNEVNHQNKRSKMFRKQFGGKVSQTHKTQYQKSVNWQNGCFQNLETADITPRFGKIPSIIWKQLTNTKERQPQQPIPVLPFNKKEFLSPSSEAKFIWYGHSAIMMNVQNQIILIDPMLGSNTTPIAPFANKRFSNNTLSLIDDFPEIDLILLTHDHYDHLDLASILKLKSKTKRYFVALGIKRHLVSWGVAAETITEFDWWETHSSKEVSFTFTPTQHFSGRGLTDRFKTLWGGWAIKTENEHIWFSGDGGYGKHFKTIGERLDPFDFAFMECGQYNDNWRPVHLFPDESIQAAIDANVKKAMPVHWAGFNLSFQHTWYEPAEEFVKFAKEKNLEYMVPALGKIFTKNSFERENWWVG